MIVISPPKVSNLIYRSVCFCLKRATRRAAAELPEVLKVAFRGGGAHQQLLAGQAI
jgi:hypothetical protein